MAKCKSCSAPVNLSPDGDPKYEAPNEKMTTHPHVQCYWNGEDRELGHSDPSDILDAYDADPGTVFEIEHVAVVAVTFQAKLPAADDAEFDDDFEVCEDTRLAAETKIAAEIERRKSIKQ